MSRRKLTPAEKVADVYEGAEMYLNGAIQEMEDSLKALRAAKAGIRIQRMNLARKIKAAGL